MGLKEKIAAAKDLPEEIVDVPEWDVKVGVRALDGHSRGYFLEQVATGEMAASALLPEMVVRSAFDPETGELIWEEDEIDDLLQKNGKAIERLGNAALTVSGMTEEGEEELGED